MVYLVVIIFLIFLSLHYDVKGKVKYRTFWYNVMLLVFILVAGLRWRLGVDTPNYLYKFYHDYPSLENYSFYVISKSPLFVLLNSIVKTIGGRFFVVQLIHAAIINGLVFKYIKKHSSRWFMCVFFYAVFSYTNYNMEIMRGSLSIVICLFANDYIIERKWIKGFALLILALLCHPQTLGIIMVLPLFFFLKFDKKGVLILIGAFFMGMIIMKLFGDYLWLFEEADEHIGAKIQSYAGSERYGGSSDKFSFVFSFFLPTFYMLLSLLFIKKKSPECKLLKLEPFLMLSIMFILVRMNVEIVSRYVDYYKIYWCMFYSELFCVLAQQRSMKRGLAYVRSLVIMAPLLFSPIVLKYFLGSGAGYRYYPYTSIFEREVDEVTKKRQMKYNQVESTKSPYVNIEEY